MRRVGLSATIDWYRANPAWWQAAKGDAEAKYATTEQVIG